LSPDDVLNKYPLVRGTKSMGQLAVLLAKESFFGREVMAGATVLGMKPGTQALPKEGIGEIKKIIFSLCSDLHNDRVAFEKSVWNKCKDAINHACYNVRSQCNVMCIYYHLHINTCI
jgi:hypothetical protein